MLENALDKMSEKTLQKFVLNATPGLLESLGAGDLAPTICDTIKTVGCRYQIVAVKAIENIGPAYAQICGQFMSLLNEAVRVSVESSCKDYSLIVEAVVKDPSASLEEKVEYVSRLKEEQHRHTMDTIKTATAQAGKFVVAAAGSVATILLTTQASKISGDIRRIDKHHQKTKRTQIRHKK